MSVPARRIATLALAVCLAPCAASGQHVAAPETAAHPPPAAEAAGHPTPAKQPVGTHNAAAEPGKPVPSGAAPLATEHAVPKDSKKAAPLAAAAGPATAKSQVVVSGKGQVPVAEKGESPQSPSAGRTDIKSALERIDRQISVSHSTVRPARPAAVPAKQAPPRIQLTWLTALSWPVELTGLGDTSSHDEGHVVTLTWH